MARLAVQRQRAREARRKFYTVFFSVIFLMFATWIANGRFGDDIARQEAEAVRTHRLGHFIVTAYCGCKKCCGHTHGITKTGTLATAKRTVAVDPRVIPLGSKVCVNGEWYVAEDTGKAIKGKRIDIFFDSHKEALAFGRQRVLVEREVSQQERGW